jgi:hypothetical protein
MTKRIVSISGKELAGASSELAIARLALNRVRKVVIKGLAARERVKEIGEPYLTEDAVKMSITTTSPEADK